MPRWLSAERPVIAGVRLLRPDRGRPIDRYIDYFGDGLVRPAPPVGPRPPARTVPYHFFFSRGAEPDYAA